MKEQYRQEVSQIHVPGELLDRTRKAVLEEEKRLKVKRGRSKVIYLTRTVAAAAVVLVAVIVVSGSGGRNEQIGVGMQLSGKEKIELQSIEQEHSGGIQEFVQDIINKIEDIFKKDES